MENVIKALENQIRTLEKSQKQVKSLQQTILISEMINKICITMIEAKKCTPTK